MDNLIPMSEQDPLSEKVMILPTWQQILQTLLDLLSEPLRTILLKLLSISVFNFLSKLEFGYDKILYM